MSRPPPLTPPEAQQFAPQAELLLLRKLRNELSSTRTRIAELESFLALHAELSAPGGLEGWSLVPIGNLPEKLNRRQPQKI